METVTLTVKKREDVGKNATKRLRAVGFVPAVLYGHGVESVALALPYKELRQHLQHHVRIMKLDFGDSTDQVLIKELQWDTFGEQLLHIDLLRVRMDEVVSMSVSLQSVGRAKGVDEGGILEIQRSDVEIKCLPTQIPEFISYDVTGLNIGDSVHLRDIPMPEGVTLDDDPDQVVASLVAKVEMAEPEPAAEEGAEGEEEGEGKEEQKAPEKAGKEGKRGDD